MSLKMRFLLPFLIIDSLNMGTRPKSKTKIEKMRTQPQPKQPIKVKLKPKHKSNIKSLNLYGSHYLLL